MLFSNKIKGVDYTNSTKIKIKEWIIFTSETLDILSVKKAR
jgi:hypothetical protein